MTIANVNIKKVLFRRGNTIQNDNYTGVFGEVSVDTEVGTLRVHDGAVAGGTRLATYAELTDVVAGNLDLTGYATTAQITAANASITAANVEIGKLRANITAANAAIVSNYNTLLSNAGVAHSEIDNLRANITAANVAWTANAATQATAINSINANLGSFQSYANATFTGGGGGPSTYSNTNVAAYLTGSIRTGNIIPTTNAVFTLGNTTHWWKELYVGSNTIYIAGVPLSIDNNDNLLINGNVVQGGNVDAVNANVSVIDANIGAYQRWANTNAAAQTTTINVTNANIGAYQIWANTNAAAQTTSINLINANVAAANLAIANKTVANLVNGSYTVELASDGHLQLSTNSKIGFNDGTLQSTAWTGNINATSAYINFSASAVGHSEPAGTITFSDGSQFSSARNLNVRNGYINFGNDASPTTGGITFNDGSFQNTASVYSNTNVAAYLSGAVTAGNVTAGNLTVEYNAVVLGNLRVAGTQTTVNASTLNITDLWVTVANSATQASDAHGAGLRVAGALANIAYSSVSDSFEFNKQIVVGNVKFSDTTRLSGNTITLPNTQGFNWYFNDPMIGSDTVSLYMNGLTTGFDSWALTTGSGANSWILDSDTQEFYLFNGGVNGGKLVFGTAANAGVRSSIDDIEVKSAVGNVYITANSNPWTFGEDGNLTLPTNWDFTTSPAISGTGIVFGDGTYQYTAWNGDTANLVNGNQTVTLETNGDLTIVNAIKTKPGQYFVVSSDTSTEMSWSNSVQAPNTGVYSGIGSGPTGTSISAASTDGTSTWVFKNWDFDMSGNLTVPGDILPTVDNTQDLGSATNRFRHLYVGPGTVYVGNAAIKTTATGNLILPGLTRAVASSAYAEEIDDRGDQTYSFTAIPTVIDNAQYSDLAGLVNGLSFTPAEYSVNQLDGEGFIDGISIDSQGSGYSDQVAELAQENMWATEAVNPINSFNPGSWVQIPFQVRSRAGESEYEFSTGGGGSGNGLVERTVQYPLGEEGDTAGTLALTPADIVYVCVADWTGPNDPIEYTVVASENYNKNQSINGTDMVLSVAKGQSSEFDTVMGDISLPSTAWQLNQNNITDGYTRDCVAADAGSKWTFTWQFVSGQDSSSFSQNEEFALIYTAPQTAIWERVHAGDTIQFRNAGSIYQSQDSVPNRYNIVVNAEKDVVFNTDEGGNEFSFTSNGALRFPNNTYQTTAYTGGSSGNIDGLTSTVGNQAAAYGLSVYSLTLNSDSDDDNPEIKVYKGTTDDNSAISIGQNVSGFRQANVVAIGNYDVGYNALPGGVYIGYGAGYNNAEQPQGLHSIAIGSKAAWDFATNNSITLNATGSQLNPDESGLFIKPIRAEAYNDAILYYNPTSGEVTYANNTGSSSTVIVGNVAEGTEGSLWYNTDDGRLYVDIDNNGTLTWVDASPSVVPSNMVGYDTDGNITLNDDASINYANGTSILTSVTNMVSYDSYGDITLRNNARINYANGQSILDGITSSSNSSGSSYGNTQVSAFLTDYQGNIYINSEGSGLIIDATGDRRVGFMKYFGIEASFVHAAGDTKSIPFRIGRVHADDITLATQSDFTTEVYIGTDGKVGINNTSPADQLDVAGSIRARGVIYTMPGIGGLVFANANSASSGSISVDSGAYLQVATSSGFIAQVSGRERIRATNASTTVSAGNDVVLSANADGVARSWTFDTNGNLSVPGNINFANGVNILSTVSASTGDITFSNSDIIGQGTNVTITADTTDWTFYSNGTTIFPDHGAVSMTGNLTVGNLIVTGNSTIINTTSYTVSDNIVQFADGNPADTLDLGFIAHRTVNSTLQHTGLIRDSSEGTWKLFSNVLTQPGSTVDFTDAIYDNLVIGGLTAGNTGVYSINFTSSPVASSSPGIQWYNGFQGGIYGDTQVAEYLSTNTATVANLRVLNTYAPVKAEGNVGDLHGQIRIDSNYLYVTTGANGQQSYTVKAFQDHQFASQYYIALAKGTYPKPENGWEITRDGWGQYWALDAEPLDYGTYWWCSISGYSTSFPAWATGDNVTLRGTTSTVWKSIPLSTIRTPAYSNSNVEAYIGANVGAYQTWANATFSTGGGSTYSNANVVANLQNFVTAISTTANITTTANVIAPNYLFANGVNILSTVSAGSSTYSNSNVIAMYGANTYVGFGNVGTAYPTQANVTQMFIGNTTTIGAGSNQLSATYILNNAYFGANGAMYARNTQSGASQFSTSGGSFTWAGTTGAVTANAYQGFGLFATLSSTLLTTYNSVGITSAGLITASAGLSITSTGITTSLSTFPLVNTTATTINFGGAATSIVTGAATANLVVGTSAGRGNVFAGNLVGIHYGNAIGTTAIYSGNVSVGNLAVANDITVANITTTGTYGNITGANVISANNVTLSGYGVTMINRPAFRIYGGTPSWWNTSNVNLKGVSLTVDYNQGSYFNSTTGVFTAPVAGLYHTTLNARVGSNNGTNQILVCKNGLTSPGNAVMMWETDTNTGTSIHYGVTTVVKLAVGDILTANITAGNVQFDQNDSWTVTYIG